MRMLFYIMIVSTHNYFYIINLNTKYNNNKINYNLQSSLMSLVVSISDPGPYKAQKDRDIFFFTENTIKCLKYIIKKSVENILCLGKLPS